MNDTPFEPCDRHPIISCEGPTEEAMVKILLDADALGGYHRDRCCLSCKEEAWHIVLPGVK